MRLTEQFGENDANLIRQKDNRELARNPSPPWVSLAGFNLGDKLDINTRWAFLPLKRMKQPPPSSKDSFSSGATRIARQVPDRKLADALRKRSAACSGIATVLRVLTMTPDSA